MIELSIIDSASGIIGIVPIAYITISSSMGQYSEGTDADGERRQRMARYIDADEFVKRVIQYPRQSTKTIGLALADTPTADVVEKERYDRLLEDATIIAEALNEYQTADVHERNVGKWEKMWHSYFKQELPCCSVCGHFSAMRWKYCPNCGAKMDKEGGAE